MKGTITRLLFPVAAGLLVLAAACGGDGGNTGKTDSDRPAVQVQATAAPPEGVKPPARTDTKPGGRLQAGGGTCEVTVTGDEAATFKAPSGLGAVATDYWFTEDEIRQSLRWLASGEGKSKEQVEHEANEAMRKDPRVSLLGLNCDPKERPQAGSISFLVGKGSRYADMPFGPKRYVIAAGLGTGDGVRAGEFGVLLTVNGTPYKPAAPGELSITRFDASAIAGTFRFDAVEVVAKGAPKRITVAGTFDYGCVGGAVCKR